MNVLDEYARRVTSGALPAGKYHRLACARHERDVARQGTPEFPYIFNLDLAERFFRFASSCSHYKGRQWAGQRVVLTDVQRFRLGSLWGWVHVETGLRRFRTHYNELPRKSGKSLESAIVAIYGTFFDGEDGADSYCTATKRDQAFIVFGDAKKLVQKNPGLARRIAVHARNLSLAKTSSKLEPLSADYDSMDGLNPHVVIVDEFHAHKNRGVIDVMETAMGARLQPIMFQITTAGNDPVSPCGDQHDYACKILDGVLTDETFFGFIAHADDSDDWLDESTWKKANPHWGISVNPDDMRALATKAKSMPAAAAAFKQKRLNLWVNTIAPCLSVDGWRKGQSAMPRDEFEASLLHQRCYVGIDLASKIDLCAASLLFPPTPTRPKWALIQRIWTPLDTLDERAHRDRAPYGVWLQQGWLTGIPGTRIDHEIVREAIVWAREHYEVELVGYDPWHADQIATDLVAKDGFAATTVLPVPQTYAGMSSACLQMQADILAGMVNANGCPASAWATSNTVGQSDTKGNLMFVKGKSRGRIDPVIAATIARAHAIRHLKPVKPAFQMMFFGGAKPAVQPEMRVE